MRSYDDGKWGICFAFSLRGSVFPKALAWSIPATMLSIGLHFALRYYSPVDGAVGEVWGGQLSTSQVWTAYNFLLAFLVTFRSGKAYARWWEGGTLLLQARGEWFNAYSSLIAFRSTDPSRAKEVRSFQKMLATLMSMLFCSALNSVAQESVDFEVLSQADLYEESVEFLKNCPDKCECILQWIQRLIVLNMESGVVPIPPPVISRVFQELSRGMVNINNVRKISDFLFPFPYAQITSIVLMLNSLLTPIMVTIFVEQWYWSALVTFMAVFAFVSLNYIAMEIECPFGVDANDLPMSGMQDVFNRSLCMLLEEGAQRVPGDQQKLTSMQEGNEEEELGGAFRRMQSVMGKSSHGRRRYSMARMPRGTSGHSSFVSNDSEDSRSSMESGKGPVGRLKVRGLKPSSSSSRSQDSMFSQDMVGRFGSLAAMAQVMRRDRRPSFTGSEISLDTTSVSFSRDESPRQPSAGSAPGRTRRNQTTLAPLTEPEGGSARSSRSHSKGTTFESGGSGASSASGPRARHSGSVSKSQGPCFVSPPQPEWRSEELVSVQENEPEDERDLPSADFAMISSEDRLRVQVVQDSSADSEEVGAGGAIKECPTYSWGSHDRLERSCV